MKHCGPNVTEISTRPGDLVKLHASHALINDYMHFIADGSRVWSFTFVGSTDLDQKSQEKVTISIVLRQNILVIPICKAPSNFKMHNLSNTARVPVCYVWGRSAQYFISYRWPCQVLLFCKFLAIFLLFSTFVTAITRAPNKKYMKADKWHKFQCFDSW